MALNMKKFKPLYLMPGKEKVREESFMTGKIKVEDQALFHNQRRRIFHKLSASNVINLDTVNQCHGSNKREHEASTADVDEYTSYKKSRNDDHTESFF